MTKPDVDTSWMVPGAEVWIKGRIDAGPRENPGFEFVKFSDHKIDAHSYMPVGAIHRAALLADQHAKLRDAVVREAVVREAMRWWNNPIIGTADVFAACAALDAATKPVDPVDELIAASGALLSDPHGYGTTLALARVRAAIAAAVKARAK